MVPGRFSWKNSTENLNPYNKKTSKKLPYSLGRLKYCLRAYKYYLLKNQNKHITWTTKSTYDINLKVFEYILYIM